MLNKCVLKNVATLAITAFVATGLNVANSCEVESTFQSEPHASTVGFSPYKDGTINMNWNTSVISTALSGALVGFAQDAQSHGVTSVNVGFATGECGSETWAGVSGATMAQANVALFTAKKIAFTLATGGAAGSFTCTTDAGMKAFVDRWASPQLMGIDFDVEAGQSPSDVQNLIQRIKALRSSHPTFKYHLTLATLAPNNGSTKAVSLAPNAPDGLNVYGTSTLQAIKNVLGWTGTESTWPKDVSVNLMVMDYGSTSSHNCVVANGTCDMGQSALQAAMNLHDHWHVPYANIELTPMIGRNDTQDEQFKLGDVPTVMTWAKQTGLNAVHYWSYDRDMDCANQWASPTCNSMGANYAGTYGYLNKFRSNL